MASVRRYQELPLCWAAAVSAVIMCLRKGKKVLHSSCERGERICERKGLLTPRLKQVEVEVVLLAPK